MSQENSAIKFKNIGFVVAHSEEEARRLALAKFPQLTEGNYKLVQDEDCLDTWFSSWLWPISVFDGINNPDNEEIKYYYPTNDLVTAPEIIFFWVARMIMAGEEYRGEEPFKNVYFTGIVRDKLGRKMSKSLGNSPDPIELIEKYGADGVRMGMLLSSPAGNDLPFDEAVCEQGRNFCNKIWNAFRLIKGWEVADIQQPKENKIAANWFDNSLISKYAEIDDLFLKYRLSEALTVIYKLFWDDFCAWYLEIIKPEFGKPIDKETYLLTLHYFEDLLLLLHPFMPFITEELYHAIFIRQKGESIMTAQCKLQFKDIDNKILHDFEKVKEIIAGIRTIRHQKNISPKEKLTLYAFGDYKFSDLDDIIMKSGNIEGIEFCEVKNKEIFEEDFNRCASFIVGTTEFAVPLGKLINAEEEIAKIQEEIAYLEGFLRSVNAKLANEKFVANAKPEVVENERKKQADAELKIQTLKTGIANLKI
jgi:valyl-tRNA synthetase